MVDLSEKKTRAATKARIAAMENLEQQYKSLQSQLNEVTESTTAQIQILQTQLVDLQSSQQLRLDSISQEQAASRLVQSQARQEQIQTQQTLAELTKSYSTIAKIVQNLPTNPSTDEP
ncbi:hypothetical protein M5689_020569 [Euphorbia peplus]|nr:hypothetical protein M5689_020569 [Euphorbia peplus]